MLIKINKFCRLISFQLIIQLISFQILMNFLYLFYSMPFIRTFIQILLNISRFNLLGFSKIYSLRIIKNNFHFGLKNNNYILLKEYENSKKMLNIFFNT